jgi:hypothetical protein
MRKPKVFKEKGRIKIQFEIKEKYPELIEKYKLELCNNCIFLEKKICSKFLIPITLSGDNCPYYRE